MRSQIVPNTRTPEENSPNTEHHTVSLSDTLPMFTVPIVLLLIVQRQEEGVFLLQYQKKNASSPCTPLSNITESLWIQLRTPTNSLIVGAIYLAPDRCNDTYTINALCSTLRCVRDKYTDDSMIPMGDFNQSQLVWSTSQDNVAVLNTSESRINPSCSVLLDEFNYARLSQLNSFMNPHGVYTGPYFGWWWDSLPLIKVGARSWALDSTRLLPPGDCSSHIF